MGPERKLWKQISCQKGIGTWHRIENTCEAGMPDCVVVHYGVTTFVELKSLRRWERNAGLSALQLHWMHKWLEAGGNCILLVKVSDTVSLIRNQRNQVKPFELDSFETAQERADYVWNGKIDWAQLSCALSRVTTPVRRLQGNLGFLPVVRAT